ncbi:MAG: acetate kinase, partial [Clostridia bacterium]
MKVLVINAGSSSLKYQLIDMDNEQMIAKGLCERIGSDGSVLKGKGKEGKEFYFVRPMKDHVVAIQMVLSILTDKEFGVLKDMNEIDAIGHRVLHSGPEFKDSVLIDENVLKIIEKNAELGPLHMPANIAGIKACLKAMPGKPNVAVFDTAFHSTMPDYAALYALPYEAYTEWHIKKYGFHGTSHKFVSGEVAKFLGKDIKDLKIITAHLGNGSSLAAVQNGLCVDTTMGLTPLEGVPMGTRSGDIDPACLEFIMNKTGMNISEMLNYLNKKSGMLGISGKSSDFRDLCAGSLAGDERCKLALDMFSYHVKKYIASFAGVMGGVDVIVFTGGVGENTAVVRHDCLNTLGFMGIEIDDELNEKY